MAPRLHGPLCGRPALALGSIDPTFRLSSVPDMALPRARAGPSGGTVGWQRQRPWSPSSGRRRPAGCSSAKQANIELKSESDAMEERKGTT
ncbi:hypothetical protein MTO96_003506 [Rhipicephalus appendiculatus]